MSVASVMADLADQGVVGIVRAADTESGAAGAQALLAAGLRVVEVSLVTPGALTIIESMAGSGGTIGAGTVRTLAQAKDAHSAGATFLVSPSLDVDVVRYAADHDLGVVPGCLTPSEMETAVRAGAQTVKIFPAQLWSPAALRGLLEAMPDLRCVPTGGVTPESAPEWIAAGALAVGMGGGLTRTDDPAAAAARLLAGIRDARG